MDSSWSALTWLSLWLSLFWIPGPLVVGTMEAEQALSGNFSCRALPAGGIFCTCSACPDNCAAPAVLSPDGKEHNATVTLETALSGSYICVCLDGDHQPFTCGNITVTCHSSGSGCEVFMVAIVVILAAALVFTVVACCIPSRVFPPHRYTAPKEQDMQNRKRKWIVLVPLPLVLAAMGLLITVALRADCH